MVNIFDSVNSILTKITATIVTWLATLLGITPTDFQIQIINVLILGLGIFIVLTLLSGIRKLLKWALIIVFGFFILSILVSIFI